MVDFTLLIDGLWLSLLIPASSPAVSGSAIFYSKAVIEYVLCFLFFLQNNCLLTPLCSYFTIFDIRTKVEFPFTFGITIFSMFCHIFKLVILLFKVAYHFSLTSFLNYQTGFHMSALWPLSQAIFTSKYYT